MPRSDEIPDSEPDLLPGQPLTWDLVRKTQQIEAQARELHVLEELRPLTFDFARLPRERTRNHGFCQRHVFTADLSEYLDLASRAQLDALSKRRKKSDSDIVYMLNRKYAKIRKFYRMLGVTRHRFNKKSFDVYLEDFRKYQSGRNGKTFYETSDAVLEESADRRRLNKLLNTDLTDVETTDDESEEEENVEPEVVNEAVHRGQEEPQPQEDQDETHTTEMEPPEVPLQPSSSISEVIPESSEDSQGIIVPAMRRRVPVIHEDPVLPSEPVEPEADIFDIPSSPVRSDREVVPEPAVEPAPEPVVILSQMSDHEPIPPHSSPPPPALDEFVVPSQPARFFSRRTRRHKFSQDHVYVTDTAITLGLASKFTLNDMYEDGKTYDEIVTFLDSVYRQKRKKRVEKEIGLGPFSAASFRDCVNNENKRLREEEGRVVVGQNDKPDEGDMFVEDDDFQLSDDDYVSMGEFSREASVNPGVMDEADENKENRSVGQPMDPIDLPQDLPVDSDSIFEIPADSPQTNESRDSAPRDASSEDSDFVFRNRVLSRNKALHGILPASFLTVSDKRPRPRDYGRKRSHVGSGALVPGVARKKRATARARTTVNEMEGFIEDGESAVEDDPADYHRAENSLEDVSQSVSTVPAVPSVFNIPSESDSGLSSDSDALSDVESDDGIGIREYDEYLSNLRESMDMDDGAEEDNSTGINYMLSRGGGGSGPKKRKKKSSAERSAGVKRRFQRARARSGLSISGERRNRTASGRSGASRGQRGMSGGQRSAAGVQRSTSGVQRSTSGGQKSVSGVRRGASGSTHASTLQGRTPKDILGGYTTTGVHRSTGSGRSHQTTRTRRPATSSVSTSRGTVSRTTAHRSQHHVSSRNTQDNPIWISDDEEDPVSALPPNEKSRASTQRRMVNPPNLQDDFYFSRHKVNGTPQLEGVEEIPQYDDQEPLSQHSHHKDNHVNVFQQTVDRLESAEAEVGGSSLSLNTISLRDYQNLQVKAKSVFNSKLLQECLKDEGHYFKDTEIIFQFETVQFSVSPYGSYSETPGLVETLLDAVSGSLFNLKSATKKLLPELRMCFIGLTQLLWTLSRSGNSSVLIAVGRSLLRFMSGQLMSLKSEKMLLFSLPYFLLLADLLHKLFRSAKNSIYQEFERVTHKVELAYISCFCSTSANRVLRWLRGEGSEPGKHSLFFESACIFFSLCINPWQYVAELQFKHKFKLLNVLNFLYFAQSRKAVPVDWECFVYELNLLANEKSPEKWKQVFRVIRKIVKDFSWTFEQELLIKMYRLESSRRFDNVGCKRQQVLWYTGVPASTVFSDMDGCLDMYLKLLTLYVQRHLDPAKKSSFMEKLVPISSIKTSTVPLLKNRANLMLVMSYLFSQDFAGHFKVIFKSLMASEAPDIYRTCLELSLVLTRCYVSQFHRLPFGILRKVLTRIVAGINKGTISSLSISECLRNLCDCIGRHLTSGIDDKKRVVQAITLACILTELQDINVATRLGYVVQAFLRVLKNVLEKTSSEILAALGANLKSELLGHLKAVVESTVIANDVLKTQCLSLWVDVSSRIGTTVGSLTLREWPYFGDSRLRTKFEFPFYTSILRSYRPVDLRYIQDDLIVMLMKGLPLLDSESFGEFLAVLSHQTFASQYLTFRNGWNVARFSAQELRQNRKQISVKALARVIAQMKRPDAEPQYGKFLHEFIKALEAAYLAHKDPLAPSQPYKDYATRLIRYIFTVAGTLVQEWPEFVMLKRELSIDKIVSSLSEQLESVSSVNELYILLVSEYILAVEGARFDKFIAELEKFWFETDGLIGDDQKISPIVVLATMLSAHINLAQVDSKWWVPFCHWLSIFADVTCQTASLCREELTSVVTVLTLLTRVSTAECTCLFYQYRAITDVYRVLEWLNYCLIGFEDRMDFVKAVNVLRGFDPEAEVSCDSSLFTSLSSRSLDTRIRGMYSDHEASLSVSLPSSADDARTQAARNDMASVRQRVMKVITGPDETEQQQNEELDICITDFL